MTAKSTNATAASARASKENTPLADVPNATLSKAAKTSAAGTVDNSDDDVEIRDMKTLTDSFGLSLRYGKEYMDDTPLTGEPGNFILSKSKDTDSLQLGRGIGQHKGRSPFQSATNIKDKPSPGRAKPPPIVTDVPPVSSKKSGVKSVTSTPVSTKDRKRRKSKPAVTPSG